MGENFENAGLEEGEISDCEQSTEDEVDSIVAQSPSEAVSRAVEDDIDDAGLLRGMLQVSEDILVMLCCSNRRRARAVNLFGALAGNYYTPNEFN